MRKFGLDTPLVEQYLIYLGNLRAGRSGQCPSSRHPVVDLIFEALPNTLILTFSSLIVAYIFGVLAGAYLAWKRGSRGRGRRACRWC